MPIDPVGPLTAADTLLSGTGFVKAINTPSELTSAGFTLQSYPTGRCIAKPAGQLRFVLNSVLDLGFPAAFDFDVTFVGTSAQPDTPGSVAYVIQFDVNQVVQKTFTLPSGLAVRVDTVTGGILAGAVPLQQPFAGVSCSGQPRVFDVFLVWARGFFTPLTPFDLTVVMFINGQQRELTLSLGIFGAHSGEPGVGRIPTVESIVNEILFGGLLDNPGLILPNVPIPPGPLPFQKAMRDALLGLASAQLAWAIHLRADSRRLQQAALGNVEAALGRMRSAVDEKE